MFSRVAFGVGFIVIGLGALAESKTAVIPIIIGVAIIIWAVRSSRAEQDAVQDAAVKDFSEAKIIEEQGKPGPHSHGKDGRHLYGTRSLIAHMSIEHDKKQQVDQALAFIRREQRTPPNQVPVMLAHMHNAMHNPDAYKT